MRRCRRTIACAAVCLAGAAAPPVRAGGPAATPPLEIELQASPATLRWTLRAHAAVVLDAATWRAVPAPAARWPDWRSMQLAPGDTASGVVDCATGPGAWFEVQVDARGPSGAFRAGAATRRPLAPSARRRAVPVARPRAADPGTVRGRFLYEDRLVDARGYTGATQRLPLRHVAAELLDAATGTVLARTLVDAEGRFEFAGAPASGRATVRVRSWTRGHPRWALRVVHPDPGSQDPDPPFVPHALETVEFDLAPGGVDLGTLVERDPDGYGAVQAFHILDLALDALEALGSAEFPGPQAGPADSLRIFWGPGLRTRFSAQSGHAIAITSPGSGDTDGWSDTIVLHEIGHFVAQRHLREANPGGIHLLGDVEQDLALAWAEGMATAFACWVRAHRAATRTNADGGAIDTDVARYVNAGLPPPDGVPGGLRFEWDVDAHRLGSLDLPRDGIGSETTIAGILWDMADAGASDDDDVALGTARPWAALRAMRALPSGRPITFEDFWVTWQARDPDPGALAPLLADARIEFAPDAAEPDGARAPALYAARPRTRGGGVVVNEIVLGALIAIEIANRDSIAVDLGGWSLVARANGSSGAPSLTCTLPSSTRLGPLGRLVVHRGGGGPAGARDVVVDNWTTPWFPGFEGAVVLRDAGGRAVDFVRWDGRDGVRSTVPPPAGTGFAGALPAAPFGQALARLEDVADRDVAADFVAADPSLGAPNDTPLVRRTFYPAGDVDVQRWEVARAGVYTIEVRRPRNGAEPRLEVRVPNATRAITHVTAAPASRVAPRVTLRLAEGDILEARTTHVGSTTRFGTYAIALFEEPEAAAPVPPVGLRTELAFDGGGARADVTWWNGSTYDALRVRARPGEWETLAGDARAWSGRLENGRQRIEIEAESAGRAIAAPVLEIDVGAWPDRLADDFAPASAADWLFDPGFALGPAAGRPQVLRGARGTARRWRAVQPPPGATVAFDHICAAAPERRATLELSADWGATWETLGRWDRSHARGPGADWTDGRADPHDWVQERIPLDAFAGRPVQLRFRIEPGSGEGWFVAALRIEGGAPPAARVVLHPAAPNPFNPSTRLRFDLPQSAAVRLDLHDAHGRHVRTLAAAPFAAGPHALDWDGRDAGGRPLASGVYFARLVALGEERTRKLVLLR